MLSFFPCSRRRLRGGRCSWWESLPALLVFYVRRYVEEPQVYLESKAKIAATGERPSLLEIFRPPLLRVTLLGGFLATGAQGGYFAVTTWLPTFLRTERRLSVLDSAGYLAVLIAGSFVGYLAGGFLADRIGRRLGFLVFALGAGGIVLTYTMIPFGNSAMLVLGFPLGFFSSGVFSGMGAFFTENFPTRVRGVGQGFTYNVGRAAGALFPTLVGILSARMPLGRGNRTVRRDRLCDDGGGGVSAAGDERESSRCMKVSSASLCLSQCLPRRRRTMSFFAPACLWCAWMLKPSTPAAAWSPGLTKDDFACWMEALRRLW